MQLTEQCAGSTDAQCGVLDDLAAGDADCLGGVFVCPLGAVATGRSADDCDSLVLDCTDTVRTRDPVDGVLQNCGDGAVVLGGDEQERVGARGGLAQWRVEAAGRCSSVSMSSL